MTFKELLESKEIVLLDGGFGTQLAAKFKDHPEDIPKVPETVNITAPEIVTAIHRSYVEAGADLIYSCTFGANSYKLRDTGYNTADIVRAAIQNARKACEGTETLVSLDLGPIGRMMEPNGDMSFDEAYSYFAEVIDAGEDADLITVETMTDLYEMRAAVLAAKEHSSLPIIATMTFERSGRTFSGTEISSMAITMTGLGVDAIGSNCSLGPDEFEAIISEISKWTDLPVIAKPNAGLPDPVTGEYNIGAEEFARKTVGLLKYGVKMVGGCCGTTPEYIKAIKAELQDKKYQKQGNSAKTCMCTAEKTIVVDRPLIIGERINPTGKKALKEAIKSGNMDYILELALKETEEGASILDVNAGVPGVDEKEVIVNIIRKLQVTVPQPLQIDSGDPEAIEAALRIYAGKAIINSVNGTELSMSSVLPLAAKYGAAVVGLTLDEDGIPKTTEKRIEIARKIMSRALDLGIKKEDIFIDCLTLTVSAEPEGAAQTLDAVERVHRELGLKTVLGVSNISFGLPARPVVNAAFLQMALDRGLDLPIMDPGDPEMIKAFCTHDLLTGRDTDARNFIAKYSGWSQQGNGSNNSNGSSGCSTADKNGAASDDGSDSASCVTPDGGSGDRSGDRLAYMIENGLEEQTCSAVKELLEKEPPLTVISDRLMPVMDKTGEDFEKGRIFIPQLLTAAKTAQKAFDAVRDKIAENGQKGPSKGTVIIATVKGDVHDIGKNIAKVVMDNYGYEIIDLGKDVDPEAVVAEVVKTHAMLVGLSALMTTTLPNMEKTVRMIKEKAPDCLIMAGGAVVTEEYVQSIGADFYVKDAQSSVKACRSVYEDADTDK